MNFNLPIPSLRIAIQQRALPEPSLRIAIQQRALPEPSLRIAIQQRVLPDYRAPFFELLAQQAGIELHVFAGKPRPAEAIQVVDHLDGAGVYPARNIHLLRGGLYLCWQAGLIRWLEEQQPEILILEANPRYLSSYAAVRWMRQRGKKVIGWGLGAPLTAVPAAGMPAFGAVKTALWRAFLRQFDALVAYSQAGAAQYRAAGIPAEKVFVAPNAAAAKPGHPLPSRALPAPGERLKVLFVGRLQERKRVDLLLRACASLPVDIQPDVRIVGDGPARSDLEQLAKEVYPQAAFTGARRGAELAEEYLRTHLFVLPGTGGLAVQQALGWGLPVMVAEADGTQGELVRPANGWLLPPGDLPALRQALEAALRDPQRLQEMGAESYRIAAEEVNLERMVGVFVAVIRAVTQK
jgi:glycosyltransferase involved in cell wall biosynthesis